MCTSFPHPPRVADAVQDSMFVQMRDALLRRFGRRPAVLRGVGVVAEPEQGGRDDGGAAVLAFPVRGEALLVKLAGMLRDRTAGQADDPFRLTLSNGRYRRLSIDRDAYVEYHAEDGSFQLKIDAPPSRLTLETTDFALLVKFVLQYSADCGVVSRSCGEAS
ncbi:hypothetical protein IP86_15205 [Rhodopseudomonas sp. AAP120]|uniref:hypothetical protein n=1 Tax=Rhodopseudomonas sp. AAP120 TaxID=1523430 RepID=UPI0006B97DE5|nr:hypothetical protein [Rhodopseudomonas sp. AAP120]KPF96846.1 hypothetical protein IP86_15205 [Rhodopseudomonas sp. AAP120]